MNVNETERPTLEESHYRLLAEASSDIIIRLNESYTVVYANHAAIALTGFNPEELVGKTFFQLIKPDKRSAAKKFYEAQLKEKTTSTYFELPLATKQGAYNWIGNNTVYTETGEKPGLICYGRNINDKIKAELQRENWMSRLLVLIENLQEGILMVDENRKITLVNRTFCDLFSVRLIPEDLVGRNYLNAQNHVKQLFADPQLFAQEEEEIINNQFVMIGQRLDLANGKVYERDFIPIYVETGFAGNLWKYRDTTEKTRIKTELIKSEKKYRSVIEAMNLGLMEVGHDDRILNANEAFCLMLGYESANGLIGKPSFDTLLEKEDQEKMRLEMANRTEGDSSTYEIKARRGDGGYAWLLINGAPLYDENNNVIGSVGIHLDITNQKRIAIELEEKRALQNLMEWQEKAVVTLEEKVHERTSEVLKQKEIIENKNLEITKSINYALRIQQAILARPEDISAMFGDSFIYLKPRDIVSGDFYYFKSTDKVSSYICIADSTGHGVPGGFMSMLGIEKLNEAATKNGTPGEILSELNTSIKNSLRHSESRISLLDGYDISLCHINTQTCEVDFAGALRPLWIIRKDAEKIEEIKGTRRSIGGRTEENHLFETHRVTLQKGDCVYLFTDGYTDQFNADKKRLSTRRLASLLLSLKGLPMQQQRDELDAFLQNWQKNINQTDDILVMGIRF